jgi:hypothetical protein
LINNIPGVVALLVYDMLELMLFSSESTFLLSNHDIFRKSVLTDAISQKGGTLVRLS